MAAVKTYDQVRVVAIAGNGSKSTYGPMARTKAENLVHTLAAQYTPSGQRFQRIKIKDKKGS